MFTRFLPSRPRPVTQITQYYRVRSGRSDYGFSFELQSNGNWRIYIILQPSYGRRSTDDHSTHRYTDDTDDRHYICWDGKISTEAEARAIAKKWAEKTERYILYGERF